MPSLFLALFPPAAVAARIAAAGASFPALAGRAILADRLHITVGYLGDRGHDDVLIAAMRTRLAAFSRPPVDMELARVRSFGDRGVRPIVLTGRFDNAPTARFRRELLSAIEGLAEVPDAGREFVPHVTLGYADADIDAELPETISFRCGSLTLVRGGDYAVLHSVPLVAGVPEIFTAWHDSPIPSSRAATAEELESLRPPPKA